VGLLASNWLFSGIFAAKFHGSAEVRGTCGAGQSTGVVDSGYCIGIDGVGSLPAGIDPDWYQFARTVWVDLDRSALCFAAWLHCPNSEWEGSP
jgi:hypothetical protein